MDSYWEGVMAAASLTYDSTASIVSCTLIVYMFVFIIYLICKNN